MLPSFRGQSLVVGNDSFCSDGFFGDAFDGATDDALRLIHLALQWFPNIDLNRLMVYGVSRGGTVALLAGIRNPEIDFVITQSGPVDFHGRKVSRRYNFQFKYQFLSKVQPIEEIRAKMIESSPILFIDSLKAQLLVLHGKNDNIVPIENALRLIKKFPDSSRLTTKITFEGHRMFQFNYVADELKKFGN